MDRSALLEEFGFEEEYAENPRWLWSHTGYPKPEKHYHLQYEAHDLSLEEPYYWILEHFKTSYVNVIKTDDAFGAAENSAFFGVSQQRLGAQQDKVSQFLATIGKMIKELFQMVRELRILDERLGYYNAVEGELSKPVYQRQRSDEITLKGIFVDLVQGGGKSAASVYGMARELEFVTLPDLFFDAPPLKNRAELATHMKSLAENFNRNVVRVLERHLHQYTQWRHRTKDEHANRRKFMLSYLLQHYEIIQMYITWIKPYLRHVEKLTLRERSMMEPDVVSAFESSMLEIEFMGIRSEKAGSKVANGVAVASFTYRTRAELKVQQEGYQRGPVHIGKMNLHLRVYAWSDEELEKYKKFREKESLALLGNVSASVEKAMHALGENLEHYIAEAKGERLKSEEKKPSAPEMTLAQRLFGITPRPAKPQAKSTKAPSKKQKIAQDAAYDKKIKAMKTYAIKRTWDCYKNFKKAHGLVQW